MPRDREPLTRRRIVAAAVQLLDQEGDAGFSMRRLAQALGVDPMAVYHHVPGKAAVIHAAIDAVVAECAVPDPVGPWQDRLRRVCTAYRGLAARHPGVFPLLCIHDEFVPNDYRVLESLYAALLEADLSDQMAVRAAWTLLGYVGGFALEELTGSMRPLREDERAALRALPRDAYPATHRVLGAMAEADPDAEFAFGLETFIAGIATLATR